MVPKIPIIKQIRLIRQNFSNQFFNVDHTKNLIVESFLGNKYLKFIPKNFLKFKIYLFLKKG